MVDPDGCRLSRQTGLGCPIIMLGGVTLLFSFDEAYTFEAELLIFFIILIKFY